MIRYFVGLGANLGQARQTLVRTIAALAREPDLRLIAQSHFYRSAPVDAEGPDFINAVIELHSDLPPRAMLARLQRLEREAGRSRPYHHAPRTLDLDLLLADDLHLNEPDLVVPHPRMHQRAFVLVPLTELAPDLTIPGRGALADWLPSCAGQVLERCPDLDAPQSLPSGSPPRAGHAP